MIRYKEIGFIAYPVTRMARARKFYEKVLGLKSNGFSAGQKNPKFIEYSVGPSNAHTLAIGSSLQWKPSRHGPTAALEVTDFDAVLAELKKHRIKPALGPFDFPTCRMVMIRDPDGNQVSLHHRKLRPRKSKKA